MFIFTFKLARFVAVKETQTGRYRAYLLSFSRPKPKWVSKRFMTQRLD